MLRKQRSTLYKEVILNMGWPKSLFSFICKMALVALTMSLRLYYDSCHISMHFKKLFKIGEFLCSHFNIKIEKQHFWHIMFYYFFLFFFLLYYLKRGKNATEMQKKICAVYGECVVTDECVKSGLQSFMLDISCWTMLYY